MGRRRDSNEDAFYVSDEDRFGLVCDGMGGHEGGEVASRLAVDILSDHCSRSVSKLRAGRGRKLASLRTMVQDLVIEWTQHANAEIYARTPEGTDARARMGTTLALLLMVEDFVLVAHVGDSRVYRIREGKIDRLTEDHSIVGQAPPKRWGQPPRQRKFVTKALGTRPTVEPDVKLEDARAGDVFILCSDGLSDLVKEPEMVKILGKAGADRRSGLRSLIHLANKRGGRDNITVVLAEVLEQDLFDSEDTETIVRPDHLKDSKDPARSSRDGERREKDPSRSSRDGEGRPRDDLRSSRSGSRGGRASRDGASGSQGGPA